MLEPPLDLPPDDMKLRVVLDTLDASEDETDFRRAKVASAELYLQAGAYNDALYEALHGRQSVSQAVDEAIDELR
jgi:hypothetical protein